MSDLPDPTGDEYRPAGPARGEPSSPSREFKGQGPLAHLDREAAPANARNELEAQMAALDTLCEGGMDEAEARAMLGLPPVYTPENKPAHVHFYEPEEEFEDKVDGWSDKQRERLVAAFTRVISAASSTDEAAREVARMYERGVAMGTQQDPWAESPGSVPAEAQPEAPPAAVCDLCGAIVADLEKHEQFAHPE